MPGAQSRTKAQTGATSAKPGAISNAAASKASHDDKNPHREPGVRPKASTMGEKQKSADRAPKKGVPGTEEKVSPARRGDDHLGSAWNPSKAKLGFRQINVGSNNNVLTLTP